MLLHNIKGIMKLFIKKWDSKFYDQVAVSSIQMQRHLEAVMGIMKKLCHHWAVDSTRRDAAVWAIIEFHACASRTTNCLDSIAWK